MNLRLVLCLILFRCTVIYSNQTVESIDNGTFLENSSDFYNKYNNSFKRSINNEKIAVESFLKDANFSDLDNLLEIWNSRTIANLWNSDVIKSFKITANCKKMISRYMAGVLNDENWALKMTDASGKHTWGLFSGSRYWTGAPDQCRAMASDFVRWQKNESPIWSAEFPPFEVAVNSINLLLNISKPGINGSHEITLGLCLPKSCNLKDVEELIDFAVNRSETKNLPRSIVLDHIRNLSEGYIIWEDKIFHIILVVFALFTSFIILGTTYDIVLRYKVLRNEEEIKINGNVRTGTKFAKESKTWIDNITLARIWSVKTHNGSVGDVLLMS